MRRDFQSGRPGSEKYKFNDHYITYYAQMAMEREPDLQGCFELRGRHKGIDAKLASILLTVRKGSSPRECSMEGAGARMLGLRWHRLEGCAGGQCRGGGVRLPTGTGQQGMKGSMRNGAHLEDKQRWMRERNAPLPSAEAAPAGGGPFQEKHYSPAALAALWGLGTDAVRRLFLDEPGVLVLGRYGSTRRQRQYRTLKIPASVAERVHRRLVNR